MIIRTLEFSVLFLLLVFPQSPLVTLVSAKSQQVPLSSSGGADQNTAFFTLERKAHRDVPLSISVTSYVGYSIKSNSTISCLLVMLGQIQNANQTGGIADPIYRQNGSLIRNVALLTHGSYYLVFQAGGVGAAVQLSYTVSPATTRNATTYFAETITLRPSHTYSIPVNYETLGSPSTLSLFGISNMSVYYTVYDRSSSSIVFRSPLVTVTNATDDAQAAKDAYKVSLPAGRYVVHVTNSHPTACLLRVEYHLTPSYVNPYLAIIRRGVEGYPKFLATGISSFGLYNESGKLTPYEIRTSEIMGFANISSISAYNPKPPPGVGTGDASLQLNAILVIKNLDGSRYEYWVQNVFAFQTEARTVNAVASVANITGVSGYLNDQTIQGRGAVVIPPSSKNGTGGNFYVSEGLPVTLELPFIFSISFGEQVRPNHDVWLSMHAAEFLRGGERVNSNTTIDDILIKDPNVSEAYFLVSGKEYAPQTASVMPDQPGLFYDAELVFAGRANGGGTTFNSLGARLWLTFLNQTTQSLQLFPSYYGFGADTFETTDNQRVTFDGRFATMVSGVPDYAYLGRSAQIPQSMLFPTATLERSGSQNPGVLALSSLGAFVIAVIIVFGFLLVRRQRWKRRSMQT